MYVSSLALYERALPTNPLGLTICIPLCAIGILYLPKLTSDLSGSSTDPTVSEKVGDNMLIIREELYDDIVKHYNESCKLTCALNMDFSECACLAFGNSNLKNVKIG